MTEQYTASFDRPDEIVEFPRSKGEVVTLGDWTVMRVVQQPGWRWSKDMQPSVGTEWCQARHVGYCIAGTLHTELQDGTTYEIHPNDVYYVPPGHDAWVVGDETYVALDWAGARAWVGFRSGSGDRILATLLFLDVVESTELVARIGDGAWRDHLSFLFESARSLLVRFRGREVATTGDGLFATFEGPAAALQFSDALRRTAARNELSIRVGVHVGEVDKVAGDVRGIAVHEAARIMSAAAAGEILVSALTKALAQGSGLTFTDRGIHELKGLPGQWELSAYAGSG